MPINPVAQAAFAFQRKRCSNSMIRKVIPTSIRRFVGRGCNYALDGVDLFLGRRRSMVPPRHMNFVGHGDFEKTGDEFFQYFLRLGRLEPSQKVLEVGCGLGRMARPLTQYLTGTYDGFDIVPAGVHWCQKNITSRHPNFRFVLADIYNKEYNPAGSLKAKEFRFPYSNGHFDFIFLTSVFTHMVWEDMRRYLSEMARVLLPGGRCLSTFFLLSEDSRALVANGESSLDFCHRLSEAWTTNLSVPEIAIAYEEEAVRELLNNSGFEVQSVERGSWCGRLNYLSYQDIVTFTKL